VSADRARPDTGSATVWVLAVASLLCALGVGVSGVVQVRVLRSAASTAADLAALAGAAELPSATLACAQAARVAAAQQARLVSCHIDGAAVAVVDALDPEGALSDLGPVTVRSRAGPPAGS
jgi:secretion/DNA translocation related TadE-like protein